MKIHDYYQRILDVAENLIQTKGYNAFSYRDIARIIGIKTSSIHYYFPTKGDLGKAVVKQHMDNLYEGLEQLYADEKLTYRQKLEHFFDCIYSKTFQSNQKMCLGGMLASDMQTLPESIKLEVQFFFKRIEDWLKRLIEEAIDKREFKINKEVVNDEASLILSVLEGSLLVARVTQDEHKLLGVKRYVVNRLVNH